MTDDENYDSDHSHLAPYPNLADLISAAMSAKDLTAKRVIDEIASRNRVIRSNSDKLAKVAPATMSAIVNGRIATPAAATLNTLSVILELNPRAVWMAAGVSYGAIDGDVNSVGACACSLSELTIVIEVDDNDLPPREVARLKNVAAQAINAELVKRRTERR
jgi:hypothetical protein